MLNFYSNILQKETIRTVFHEIFSKKNERTWRTSKHTWTPYLTENSVGTILIHDLDLSSDAGKGIINDISKYMKENEEITSITYTEWQQLSLVNWHNDGDRAFGMTIYLNEVWEWSWGGFFCWQDGPDTKLALPVFNNGLMVREGHSHFVSMTSPLAPIRRTLQIIASCKTSQ